MLVRFLCVCMNIRKYKMYVNYVDEKNIKFIGLLLGC